MIRTAQGLEQRLIKLILIVFLLFLCISVVFPIIMLLDRSMHDRMDNFVGAANFVKFFTNPGLFTSLINTLFVSVMTTVISLPLGLGYAFFLSRFEIRGRVFFRLIAMVPLFAPTMLQGIALRYLFGNKGLITTGFFGWTEQVLGVGGINIHLYGPVGIIIAEVFYTFPQVYMILTMALSMSDARLYEAAESLYAKKHRLFLDVTLPGIKYGLISAAFVAFTLSFTDFGAPKIVGGNFNVLAVGIYKQVVGQQNFGLGSTISIILMLPTFIAFLVDRYIQSRQRMTFSSKAVPLQRKYNKLMSNVGFIYCLIIVLMILLIVGAAIYASLVVAWPYNLNIGLRHFNFNDVAGNGIQAFWNSITAALLSAFIGTAIVFSSAYMIEKMVELPWLRKISYLLSIIPLALPGLVIGIAYIFFFNAPAFDVLGMEIPNPFNGIYGTIWIIVLANIIHFYSVNFLTATTSLRKLDKEIEEVSKSLAIPFYKAFGRVTLPVNLHAVIEIFSYFFVNSMATISAVIFLYSPKFKLASVLIVNMDDAGDIAEAAAMSVLILLTNILFRMIIAFIQGNIETYTEKWKRK